MDSLGQSSTELGLRERYLVSGDWTGIGFREKPCAQTSTFHLRSVVTLGNASKISSVGQYYNMNAFSLKMLGSAGLLPLQDHTDTATG